VWNEKLKTALQKLSPDHLQNYGGVIFASIMGDLPIPDMQRFWDWIKAGHAFVGIHAASDTFHGWPVYSEMLGGEFKRHAAQVSVNCPNQDSQNPATVALPKVWTIAQEEIYQFIDYDPAKVHDLPILDKHPETGAPGHAPFRGAKIMATKEFFYTSLGHREDLIDADQSVRRKNPLKR
jgi:type 1 glutamine amidotransferase